MVKINDLLESEKEVRCAHYRHIGAILGDYAVSYGSDEARKKMLNQLEKELSDQLSWEEENSKFWLRTGKMKGMTSGVVVGTVLALTAHHVGKYLASKN